MTKPHKIQVRNSEGSEGTTTRGMNTQVLLDGVPLKFCKSFKFEVEAGGVAKVVMEMYAEVEMDIASELEKTELKSTDLVVQDDKMIALYALSSPYPLVIAEVKDPS